MNLWTQPFGDKGLGPFFMDFSLLRASEFFVFRKMKMPETINHPLCGCASIVIQKNYLSVYNKVVQAILQKGKVIYGEERKFTRTYEMDVQISYRLHTKV